MAIWKEPTSTGKETPMITPVPETPVKREPEHAADFAPTAMRRPTTHEPQASTIAADITITGKIEGAGEVRIAGKFDGDVHIQGDLTVAPGAKLTGSVRAKSVTIGGEVDGNIDSAASVELLSTGVLNGDLKAGTLTVASGSRMRGKVEFGWPEEAQGKASLTLGARPLQAS